MALQSFGCNSPNSFMVENNCQYGVNLAYKVIKQNVSWIWVILKNTTVNTVFNVCCHFTKFYILLKRKWKKKFNLK